MTTEAPERVIEFPALKEAQAKLDAKRKEAADFLKEAGPEFDMGKVKSVPGDTHAKVAHLNAMNAAMEELKADVDEKLVIGRAAALAKEREQVEPGHKDLDEERPRTKDGRPVAFGKQFMGSDAVKGFVRGSGQGPQAHIDVELKTLFSTTGWEPETTRTGRVEMFPTRPAPHVADLIPQTTTNQVAVVYMEEVVYNNTASETAEGDQFPEATLDLDEKSVAVRKIPVFLPVTDELFADEARAEGYVQNRLPFMIRQRLDLQILRGNNTAPNLLGTENVSGIISQAKGADTVPDALYKTMRRIRDTGFAEPSVVFITPAKWEPVRLMRTADGIYIWGHPSMPGPMTIWGVPVIETTAAPSTKALMGDYTNFSELSVRRGIDVQVSNSHGDFFARGKLAVRADIRCAVIHYRPLAFGETTGL